MIDEPEVDRAELVEAVRRGWGRTITALTFLPIGLDVRAFAYEVVTGDGERLFLKVRLGAVDPVAVALPRYLHRIGLREVVAPLDTVDDGPPPRAAGHELLLYPFIQGGSRMEPGLSDRQWAAYGGFVGALHCVTLPPELVALLPIETFAPPAPAAVRGLGERILAAGPGDAMHRELAGYWDARAADFGALAARTDELARLAVAQRAPAVVCHADIHLDNVLADGDGPLHVVDWDAPVLAPRERDLVFAISGGFAAQPVTPRRRSLFLQAYGRSDVNQCLMTYYLYERLVDDIREFAEGVLRPGASEESRRLDLDYLKAQLAPDGSATLARTYDAGLRRG